MSDTTNDKNQAMNLIDVHSFVTKLNETIDDEIDQSTDILNETFCETFHPVSCDLNETFCQSSDTGMNESFFQSSDCTTSLNLFSVAAQSNDIGIIFGNNSSLIFSFDEETPSIRGCAAVGLLSGSTKKSSFMSLSVSDFCAKFQCLSTSSKLSFTWKTSSIFSELRSMVRLCCSIS